MKSSLVQICIVILMCISAILPRVVQAQYAHVWSYTSALGTPLRESIESLNKNPVQEIIIPVQDIPVSSITNNFGDPRPNGRVHEGIDIMAPSGTPTLSSTDAVVIRTGYGASAGHYVYTANPGGETFIYMHLKEASMRAVGDAIKAGDVIGLVGNTGNASGGLSHLHFEIRDNTFKALDPYPRLTKEFTQEVEEEQESNSSGVENTEGSFPIESLPQSNLTLKSRGSDVLTLQKFLIYKNSGQAAQALAQANPTGYFGSITKTALAEYQRISGIVPASGYYGPKTRNFISNLSMNSN